MFCLLQLVHYVMFVGIQDSSSTAKHWIWGNISFILEDTMFLDDIDEDDTNRM